MICVYFKCLYHLHVRYFKDLPMKCDVDDGWDGLTADRCFKLFDKKHIFEEAK